MFPSIRARCATLLAVTALAGVAAAGGLSGTAARAATSGGVTTANVTVGSAIALSGLTSSFTLTGNPGDTPTAVVTMTVTTNNGAGYSVTVEPEAETLNPPTGDGNSATIPFGDVKVRETGTSTYTALTPGTPLEVHHQTTPSAADGDSLSDDYTITVPFVPNDTYTGKIDYVATTL